MFQIHDRFQVFFTVDIQLSDNMVRGSCQFIMSLFPGSRYRLQGVILHPCKGLDTIRPGNQLKSHTRITYLVRSQAVQPTTAHS